MVMVKLCRSWLSSGHIQLQSPLPFCSFILKLQFFFQCQQFFFFQVHCTVSSYVLLIINRRSCIRFYGFTAPVITPVQIPSLLVDHIPSRRDKKPVPGELRLSADKAIHASSYRSGEISPRSDHPRCLHLWLSHEGWTIYQPAPASWHFCLPFSVKR